MPRITTQYAQKRRRQVLDGARKCFAEHGYEGATVRLLSQEIGLSSGAIFNYFPSKLDLFIAIAEEDSNQAATLWEEGGLPAVVEGFAASGSDLSGSYLELGRRVWSDPDFRKIWEQRGESLEAAIHREIVNGVQEGRYRSDLPAAVLAEFATIVLDGFMLRLRVGGLPEHREDFYALLMDAIRATPAS